MSERQKHLATSLYLWRVRYLREDHEDPSKQKVYDEYHVAQRIEDVYEHIADYLEDEKVEVEGILREVPVLSIIEPKPRKEDPEDE